jgi:2,4-dienoyl-CoA reductase-like NADH-dependent reductase (Old Yellow Enzyme family)/thioredoxin reductase
MTDFPKLFSPFRIGNLEVANRIVLTAHHTHLSSDVPTDELVAYYQSRAAGGVGLIIVEVAGVHSSARFSSHFIQADNDACIAGYRKIARTCHQHNCPVLGQLYHPGRETRGKVDGVTPVAWAPSALPGERHHVMPRAMPPKLVKEVINGYGSAAHRLVTAGLDGVEVLASHGYLLAQFLSPRINHRTDEYGGSLENRTRLIREVITSIRSNIGDRVLGIRLSSDAIAPDGANEDEMLEICRQLEADGDVDYFSFVLGSSSTLGGSTHIVPPMEMRSAYVMPSIAKLKSSLTLPVLATGRINQPQVAEAILSANEADLCGMTRALIADPVMPAKAKSGDAENIRACIACNQACTGHTPLASPISCIQYPESGRELSLGVKTKTREPRRILVAGGGPAGLKAATVAAERGHRVTLYEKAKRIGGQVLLAQRLPSRSEFGGLADNLQRECAIAGVEIITGVEVTPDLVARKQPDAVVVATGALPYVPELPGREEAHVVTSWQVLAGEVNVGASVVIADWRSDWIGLGLAEQFAAAGSRVRLCVTGTHAGETLQMYVRDALVARTHRLGVEVIPYARLFGVDADTVYFQHTASDEPMLLEQVDTLVLASGHEINGALETALEDYAGELHVIGDCLSPRTAEEAVYEGLQVGREL